MGKRPSLIVGRNRYMSAMERSHLIPGVDFVAPAECMDTCPNISDAVEASVMAMASSSCYCLHRLS